MAASHQNKSRTTVGVDHVVGEIEMFGHIDVKVLHEVLVGFELDLVQKFMNH